MTMSMKLSEKELETLFWKINGLQELRTQFDRIAGLINNAFDQLDNKETIRKVFIPPILKGKYSPEPGIFKRQLSVKIKELAGKYMLFGGDKDNLKYLAGVDVGEPTGYSFSNNGIKIHWKKGKRNNDKED